MLGRLGIRPTHVLWHQGESDVFEDTAEEDYVAQFRALATSLPALGIDAPLLPAVATRCDIRGDWPEHVESAAHIRSAQRSLPDRIASVRPGPDTDTITGPRFRPDSCHFSHRGIAGARPALSAGDPGRRGPRALPLRASYAIICRFRTGGMP